MIKDFCRKYYDRITGSCLWAVVAAAILATYVFKLEVGHIAFLIFAAVCVIISVACCIINDSNR